MINQLNKVFLSAYRNTRCDLYRRLYLNLPDSQTISTYNEWESLPFLTKEFLQETPLNERMFTDQTEVDVIRTSSGTSGKPPLMTYRNHDWMYDPIFSRVTPTGLLAYCESSHLFEHAYRRSYPTIPIINGSYHNFEVAIKIAVGLPINSLCLLPSACEFIVPKLDTYGILQNIKLVHLQGERVTYDELVGFKKNFNQALISVEYSSTETHDILMGNSIASDDESLSFQYGPIFNVKSPDIYMELRDIETNKIIKDVGVPGEIVVTQLWYEHNPSPMLRYRTGDLAEYVQYGEVHRDRKFVIHGRINVDRISIPKGMLTTSLFDQTMKNFPEVKQYQLHYNLQKPFITSTFDLHLVVNKPLNKEEFVKKFMTSLSVSPKHCFGDFVNQGLYPTINCIIVDSLTPEPGKKLKKFVQN